MKAPRAHRCLVLLQLLVGSVLLEHRAPQRSEPRALDAGRHDLGHPRCHPRVPLRLVLDNPELPPVLCGVVPRPRRLRVDEPRRLVEVPAGKSARELLGFDHVPCQGVCWVQRSPGGSQVQQDLRVAAPHRRLHRLAERRGGERRRRASVDCPGLEPQESLHRVRGSSSCRLDQQVAGPFVRADRRQQPPCLLDLTMSNQGCEAVVEGECLGEAGQGVLVSILGADEKRHLHVVEEDQPEIVASVRRPAPGIHLDAPGGGLGHPCHGRRDLKVLRPCEAGGPQQALSERSRHWHQERNDMREHGQRQP
mmetsp:Transcript_66440/g.143319  ORF Transcript_66440/g.143319 Transcript_66440/m.143319 type:complete len:308 (-) Transcript_66440:1375-2298(-)